MVMMDEPIIIYDLARTYSDNLDHIYTTIENFKNGQYLSTKYETQQRFFKIPNIIVMANFKPDITKLSNDRWDIVDIKEDNNKDNNEIYKDNNEIYKDNNEIYKDSNVENQQDNNEIDNIIIKDFTEKKPMYFLILMNINKHY